MVFTVLIIVWRRPGMSPQTFYDHYENVHMPLIGELAGDTILISHNRLYVTRESPELKERTVQPFEWRTLENVIASENERQRAAKEVPGGELQAWWVVFACFLFSGSLLSYGMSWGGVLVELREHFPDEGLTKLNLISGVNNAFTNGIGFFSGRFADCYGHKLLVTVNVLLCVSSMVGAAFCQNRLDLLFDFQGGFLGLDIGLCYPSIVNLPSHDFLRRLVPTLWLPHD
ncbi:hypothetical protein JCM8547_005836 [Rhodosporidiobolus lusitaniae]